MVFILSLLALAAAPLIADDAAAEADAKAAYERVIAQRAEGVLGPVGIDDAATHARARAVIAGLYRDLSRLHDARDAAIKALRQQDGLPAAAVEAAIRAIQEGVAREQLNLNLAFTGALSAILPPAQVVAVKDGITHGVVPLTYRVYMEMLPDLSEDQRQFIMAQLAEAREHAVTAGSSEGRHQLFGRAKGRINNRLSAEGIDMKQAEADLRARSARN